MNFKEIPEQSKYQIQFRAVHQRVFNGPVNEIKGNGKL